MQLKKPRLFSENEKRTFINVQKRKAGESLGKSFSCDHKKSYGLIPEKRFSNL